MRSACLPACPGRRGGKYSYHYSLPGTSQTEVPPRGARVERLPAELHADLEMPADAYPAWWETPSSSKAQRWMGVGVMMTVKAGRLLAVDAVGCDGGQVLQQSGETVHAPPPVVAFVTVSGRAAGERWARVTGLGRTAFGSTTRWSSSSSRVHAATGSRTREGQCGGITRPPGRIPPCRRTRSRRCTAGSIPARGGRRRCGRRRGPGGQPGARGRWEHMALLCFGVTDVVGRCRGDAHRRSRGQSACWARR